MLLCHIDMQKHSMSALHVYIISSKNVPNSPTIFKNNLNVTKINYTHLSISKGAPAQFNQLIHI